MTDRGREGRRHGRTDAASPRGIARRALIAGAAWLLAVAVTAVAPARAADGTTAGATGAGQEAAAKDGLDVRLVYLERQVERPPVLYNLDPLPEDEGLSGARLGVADNRTTGKFLKHRYTLDEVIVAAEDDWLDGARAVLASGARLIVVNAPADDLLALSALPEAKDAVIVNAGAADTRLRDADCRPNLLHALPSRDMVTDALAQYLARKRWANVFLIVGPTPADEAYAAALRRSLKKFGAKIVAEKGWSEAGDLRRNAAAEVPLLTQARDYDVVVVADEAGDFGRYVVANTWLPRPVAGTAGLRAAAWAPVVEQWGAVQLQNRFRDLAKRDMRPVDYAAWAGVRVIGEAVTRLGKADPAAVKAFLLSPEFALAGFKGAKLSFRTWNGQLRQPIPIVHPEALVAYAPIEGFLHQRTELDTLGLDQPETKCETGPKP